MFLIFSFRDGRTMEAALLAIGTDTMRVAVPGQPDATEFRLVDGFWTTEEGERLELASWIPGASGDPRRLPQTRAMGASGGAPAVI